MVKADHPQAGANGRQQGEEQQGALGDAPSMPLGLAFIDPVKGKGQQVQADDADGQESVHGDFYPNL